MGSDYEIRDSYLNNADWNLNAYDGQAFTWQHGRELKSLTKAGQTYTCSYDEDGYRVKKHSGETVTRYYLNGSTILTQKTGNDRMDFLYDANEELLGFKDNGTTYYYRKSSKLCGLWCFVNAYMN